jgi:hypothetical protein
MDASREEDEDVEELVGEEDDSDLPFEQWRSSRPMTDYFSTSLRQEPGVGPQPCCTFIEEPTAFHLNYDPSVGSANIDEVAETYGLSDLQSALADYIL